MAKRKYDDDEDDGRRVARPGRVVVHWSTRKMPFDLLERFRMCALRLGPGPAHTMQALMTEALELGLPELETRAKDAARKRREALNR